MIVTAATMTNIGGYYINYLYSKEMHLFSFSEGRSPGSALVIWVHGFHNEMEGSLE